MNFKFFEQLSLRNKLFLAFVVVVLIPLTLYSIFLYMITVFGLTYIENFQMQKGLNSTLRIIESKGRTLLRETVDYGNWHEMWSWIKTRDPEWLRINVIDWVPQNFNVQLIAITDLKGKVLYQYGDFPEYQGLIADNPLVKEGLKFKEVFGIIKTSRGLALIAASPIHDSTVTPKLPQNGVLLYGQLIDQKFMNNLKELTGNEITIFEKDIPVASTKGQLAPRIPSKIWQTVSFEGEVYIDRSLREVMAVYGPLKDLEGSTIGLVEVVTPREAVLGTRGNIRNAAIILIFLGLLLAVGLVYLLRGLIIEPILKLEKAIETLKARK